jgi:hypothetical protein
MSLTLAPPPELKDDVFYSGYRYDLESQDGRPEMLRSLSVPFMDAVSKIDFRRPDYYDPRGPGGHHIRNQGPVGSCRGHSGSAGFEHCWFMATGDRDIDQDGTSHEKLDDRFSPLWYYITTQRHDGISGDRGSTIAGGVKTATEDGCCREVTWEYKGRYETTPPREAAAEAKQFRLTRSHFFESSDKVFDEAVEWILSGQGYLDFGTVWPLPFINNGVVDRVPSGTRGGGHATAGIGVIPTSKLLDPPRKGEPVAGRMLMRDDDELLIIVANSHGTQAQHNGFYYFTRRGLTEVLRHQYTTLVGMSDMGNVRPRNFSWSGRNPLSPNRKR